MDIEHSQVKAKRNVLTDRAFYIDFDDDCVLKNMGREKKRRYCDTRPSGVRVDRSTGRVR